MKHARTMGKNEAIAIVNIHASGNWGKTLRKYLSFNIESLSTNISSNTVLKNLYKFLRKLDCPAGIGQQAVHLRFSLIPFSPKSNISGSVKKII